jgi:hypothetical protein
MAGATRIVSGAAVGRVSCSACGPTSGVVAVESAAVWLVLVRCSSGVLPPRVRYKTIASSNKTPPIMNTSVSGLRRSSGASMSGSVGVSSISTGAAAASQSVLSAVAEAGGKSTVVGTTGVLTTGPAAALGGPRVTESGGSVIGAAASGPNSSFCFSVSNSWDVRAPASSISLSCRRVASAELASDGFIIAIKTYFLSTVARRSRRRCKRARVSSRSWALLVSWRLSWCICSALERFLLVSSSMRLRLLAVLL